MKTIENNSEYRTELKFKNKKEVKTFLENSENGYILSEPINNGTDTINKDHEGNFYSFASGLNWCDAGKSYHSIDIIVNSIWNHRGSCWVCWSKQMQNN